MSGGRLEHPPLPIGRTRYETPSVCRSDRCSRSEEHTSELQSQSNLVCRLLLEKKKKSGLMVKGRSSQFATRCTCFLLLVCSGLVMLMLFRLLPPLILLLLVM